VWLGSAAAAFHNASTAVTSSGSAVRILIGTDPACIAGARPGSLVLDRPETDWIFWANLAVEIGCAATALAAGRDRSGAALRSRRHRSGHHRSGHHRSGRRRSERPG
jgi:hypothetical protein